MYVYEAVGAALERCGVDTLFGLMGDGNLRYISTIAEKGSIRYIATRHEATAVAMADGYARSTGKVGVCTVTQGPGLTNTLTAITAARDARSGIVILAGDTPNSLPGHYQAIDQEAVFATAGALVQPIRSPKTVAEDIDRAIRLAQTERRPVGVFMTVKLQELPTMAPADTPLWPPAKRLVIPDERAIAEAVDLIRFADRPVIIGGLGAVHAGAEAALERLAEQIGALLFTTVRGKGLFADNPHHLGIFGDLATDLGSEIIGRSDLVLAFGASLNFWTTVHGDLLPKSRMVIHCDADANSISRFSPATYGIIGDARLSAEQLSEALASAEPKRGFRTDAVDQQIRGFRLADTFTPAGTDDTLDPRELMLALDELLPEERTLTVDGGHFTGFPTALLRSPDPQGFLWAVNFGSIGLSLGTGLGGAVGRPDRTSVVLVGDGGLMMNLGDLQTAARYKIPVLILVINDGAFGAELHNLQLLGMPDEESYYGDLEFAGIAESMGVPGTTVRTIKELEQLRPWLENPEGPLLVDCKIEPSVRAEWIEAIGRLQVMVRRKIRERA